MSLDRIKLTAAQILNRVPAVRGKSEDTTKQALVLPMLDALGFDIWNPAEVCLEYDADFAIKKLGQKEKVDIAVFANDVPRIYIEVKSVDFQLDGHQGQLARYFNSTSSVTLGIITNGIESKAVETRGEHQGLSGKTAPSPRSGTVPKVGMALRAAPIIRLAGRHCLRGRPLQSRKQMGAAGSRLNHARSIPSTLVRRW